MPDQQNNRPQARGFNAQFGRAAAGGWSDVTSNPSVSEAPSVVPPPRVRVGPQPPGSQRTQAPDPRIIPERLHTTRERSRQPSQVSERRAPARPQTYARSNRAPSATVPDQAPPTYSESLRQSRPPPSFTSSAGTQQARPSQWTPVEEVVEDAPTPFVSRRTRNTNSVIVDLRVPRDIVPEDSVSNFEDSRPLEDRLADLYVARRQRRPSERTHKSKSSAYSSEGSNYSVEVDESGNKYLARRRNKSGNVRNSLGYLLT